MITLAVVTTIRLETLVFGDSKRGWFSHRIWFVLLVSTALVTTNWAMQVELHLGTRWPPTHLSEYFGECFMFGRCHLLITP